MYTGVIGLSSLLETIICEVSAEQQRQHELKLKELSIIENSNLRNEFAAQLLLDRMLAPVEQAQYQIQNAAKEAQWLSEIVNYYFRDHGLTEQEAHELAAQLRLLAIQITTAESLHDLKFVYTVATLFTVQISRFKHWKLEYRLEHNMRHRILNPLNMCIATENNFRRRTTFMGANEIPVENV